MPGVDSRYLALRRTGCARTGRNHGLAWPAGDIPYVGKWYPPSWGGRMAPDFYNMLFSMHATIMIFFVIIPMLVGAFGNFTIPLMIGAKDMAFPKLNMMSYWFMWPAFFVILVSFFVDGGAPAAGWTSYATLTSATIPIERGGALSPFNQSSRRML